MYPVNNDVVIPIPAGLLANPLRITCRSTTVQSRGSILAANSFNGTTSMGRPALNVVGFSNAEIPNIYRALLNPLVLYCRNNCVQSGNGGSVVRSTVACRRHWRVHPPLTQPEQTVQNSLHRQSSTEHISHGFRHAGKILPLSLCLESLTN